MKLSNDQPHHFFKRKCLSLQCILSKNPNSNSSEHLHYSSKSFHSKASETPLSSCVFPRNSFNFNRKTEKQEKIMEAWGFPNYKNGRLFSMNQVKKTNKETRLQTRPLSLQN